MGVLTYQERKRIASERGAPNVVNAFELRSSILNKVKHSKPKTEIKSKEQTVALGTGRTISDISSGVLKSETGFFAVPGEGVATGKAAELLQKQRNDDLFRSRQQEIWAVKRKGGFFINDNEYVLPAKQEVYPIGGMNKFQPTKGFMDEIVTGMEEQGTARYLKAKEVGNLPIAIPGFPTKATSINKMKKFVNKYPSKATDPVFSRLKVSDATIKRYETGKKQPYGRIMAQGIYFNNKIMNDIGKTPITTGAKLGAYFVGGGLAARGLKIASKSKYLAFRAIPKGTAIGIGAVGIGTEGFRYVTAPSPRAKGEQLATTLPEWGAMWAGFKSIKIKPSQTKLSDFGFRTVKKPSSKSFFKYPEPQTQSKSSSSDGYILLKKTGKTPLFSSLYPKRAGAEKISDFWHSPFKAVRMGEKSIKLSNKNKVLGYKVINENGVLEVKSITKNQAIEEWRARKIFQKSQKQIEKQDKFYYDTIRKFESGKIDYKDYKTRLDLFSNRKRIDIGQKIRLPGKRSNFFSFGKKGTITSIKPKTRSMLERPKLETKLERLEKLEERPASKLTRDKTARFFKPGKGWTVLPKGSSKIKTNIGAIGAVSTTQNSVQSLSRQGQGTTTPSTLKLSSTAGLAIFSTGVITGKLATKSLSGSGLNTKFPRPTTEFPPLRLGVPSGGGIFSRTNLGRDMVPKFRYNPSISSQVLNIRAGKPGKGWQTGLGFRPILGVKHGRRKKRAG